MRLRVGVVVGVVRGAVGQVDEGRVQDAEGHDQRRDLGAARPAAAAVLHQAEVVAAPAHGARLRLRQEGELLRSR